MNKLVKATTVLFIITVFSKIIGFARETILVSTYGPSIISDAYIVSMNIPISLFEIISASLSTTFIPYFCKIEAKKGSEEALKFSNNLINIVILLSFILSVFAFIFATPLVKIFAIDFTGEKLQLTVEFTRILVFTMVFVALSNMMSCWLQIKGEYNVPGLIGLPYNIIIISSIFISVKLGAMWLAIGAFIASLSKLLFQIPFAYKKGYRYKFFIDFKDENIKNIILLIMPVLIGVGVSQINSIVDSTLASTLGDGIITVLNSASKLEGFVTGIFITTIISIIYPVFSKLSKQENAEEFKNTIRKSLNIVILIMIPVSIGAIVLASPIVKVLFERGKFDAKDTLLTAQALKYYAIGIVASGVNSVVNRIFYSMEDTKTPMVNGIIAIIINIVLNFILINYMGHRGLAFATSISYVVRLILSFRKLKLKINDFGQIMILKTLSKSLFASIIMGIVVYILNSIINCINLNSFIAYSLSLFFTIFIGGILYLFIIVKMDIDEVKIIFNMFKSKISSK